MLESSSEGEKTLQAMKCLSKDLAWMWCAKKKKKKKNPTTLIYSTVDLLYFCDME